MVERVLVTDAALELIERLKRAHGPLMFHQSGGCCDGGRLCATTGEFRVGRQGRVSGTSGAAPSIWTPPSSTIGRTPS